MENHQSRGSKRHLRRGLQVVLFSTLLLSLLLNFLIWSELKLEYREMKSVRLDPLGVRNARYSSDSPAAATPDLPVALFFGDSRAAMWPAPNVPGWRFSHRGIDGQTTEQAVGRMRQQVSEIKPTTIILQCGINDLTAIGVMPERQDAIIARCKENLHAMIEIGKDSGATVIVTTIFPTGPVSVGRRPFWSDRIKAGIDAVNADLRSIHNPRIVVIDSDQLLLDGGEVRRGYALDTLHLTPQGYVELNATLVKSLK